MELEHRKESVSEARRRFLAACGKFSVATPPAIALLLAAADRKYAVAHSGGGGGDHDHDHDDHHHHHDFGNNGFGNGGDDGVPGHSHHEDNDR